MTSSKTKFPIISLGGGCDVATELLQAEGLHTTTHFFDFLWNLDGGLENVTQIIAKQFRGFGDLEDFIFRKHPQWNTPSIKGKILLADENLNQAQLVHRQYQNIAFVHHRHNQEMVDSFQRKVQRFLTLLSSSEPVVFIYYRQYHAPINGNYFNNWDYNVEGKIEFLEKETKEFEQQFAKTFPHKPFRIISLFMEPYPAIEGITEKINHGFAQLQNTERIIYDRVYRRGTPLARDSWKALLKHLE